jgi:hypothetical protein
VVCFTYPPDSPATCSASEDVEESGVESVALGCSGTSLSAAGSHTCTFTNTVLFEGIPTLSQYGLALLALLTLGVGFVGLRRIVGHRRLYVGAYVRRIRKPRGGRPPWGSLMKLYRCVIIPLLLQNLGTLGGVPQ